MSTISISTGICELCEKIDIDLVAGKLLTAKTKYRKKVRLLKILCLDCRRDKGSDFFLSLTAIEKKRLLARFASFLTGEVDGDTVRERDALPDHSAARLTDPTPTATEATLPEWGEGEKQYGNQ